MQSAENFWSDIKNDYSEFYSVNRFMRMGVVFAGGAILAHSDADQNFQDEYQNDIRSNSSDDFSAAVKSFGEGKYLIPLSLTGHLERIAFIQGVPKPTLAIQIKYPAVILRPIGYFIADTVRSYPDIKCGAMGGE